MLYDAQLHVNQSMHEQRVEIKNYMPSYLLVFTQNYVYYIQCIRLNWKRLQITLKCVSFRLCCYSILLGFCSESWRSSSDAALSQDRQNRSRQMPLFDDTLHKDIF